MVKKLQKEGSLEPQIEDLINRISELQQGKKTNQEVGEARARQEVLCGELDSLNGEKVHLEEVLSKKQEAVMILRQHCQEREKETQRLEVEEQLEDLTEQHKDLWEFHMLEQRLAQEIGALERSKEQLLAERTMLWARLQEVEQRLHSARDLQGAPAEKHGMKAEIEKVGEQTGSAPDPGVCREEAGRQLPCAHKEEDPEQQQVELTLTSP
ncbi:synaptonemal complex central element protein 1-like isoform X1 [Sciurus carolinensis]|uniref:synaptonemal complex central element protein 1-like isoform X1 n=1 Tax=Sciurus carolinensis TaxID=30640 RepID=UPI001FB37334|nr:synaptonemal complex central element protein 1-like isoform X1 [Sciurus carolinensis]